jgi:hypothetical protein
MSTIHNANAPDILLEQLDVQVTALKNEGLALARTTNQCPEHMRDIALQYAFNENTRRHLAEAYERKSIVAPSKRAIGITTQPAHSISFGNTGAKTIPSNTTVEIIFTDCVGMLLCKYGDYLGWIESKFVVQRVYIFIILTL